MLCLTIALSFLPSRAFCQQLPKVSSISAVAVRDMLFVDIEGARPHCCQQFGCGSFSPARLPMNWLGLGVPDGTPILCAGLRSYSRLARIECQRNTLLFRDCSTLPIKFVPFLDGSEFASAAIELTFGKGKRYEHLTGPFGVGTIELLFPNHREPDFEPPLKRPPIRGAPFEDTRRETARTDYFESDARFGAALLSPTRLKLFHVVSGRLFVSTEPAHLVKWLHEKNPPKPPPRELRTGDLPKEFGASKFTVYASGDKHYLVTDKGTVYMVTPDGKDKATVSAIWTDPKRWVMGVYSDSDGAVYGFGYDGPFREPGRFFIRFDPSPAAVSYKMTVKEDETDYASKVGQREAYECGRAIWAAKQQKAK